MRIAKYSRDKVHSLLLDCIKKAIVIKYKDCSRYKIQNRYRKYNRL